MAQRWLKIMTQPRSKSRDRSLDAATRYGSPAQLMRQLQKQMDHFHEFTAIYKDNLKDIASNVEKHPAGKVLSKFMDQVELYDEFAANAWNLFNAFQTSLNRELAKEKRLKAVANAHLLLTFRTEAKQNPSCLISGMLLDSFLQKQYTVKMFLFGSIAEASLTAMAMAMATSM